MALLDLWAEATPTQYSGLRPTLLRGKLMDPSTSLVSMDVAEGSNRLHILIPVHHRSQSMSLRTPNLSVAVVYSGLHPRLSEDLTPHGSVFRPSQFLPMDGTSVYQLLPVLLPSQILRDITPLHSGISNTHYLQIRRLERHSTSPYVVDSRVGPTSITAPATTSTLVREWNESQLREQTMVRRLPA